MTLDPNDPTMDLTRKIIAAAIDVHRALGPGLLESTYAACLEFELAERAMQFQRQVALPVVYKGVRVDCGYRIDLIVEGTVIVEVKAVERLAPVHSAQVITYLKLNNSPVGLLLNFNVPVLKQGIKRLERNSHPRDATPDSDPA